jgi:hypothetical protein
MSCVEFLWHLRLFGIAAAAVERKKKEEEEEVLQQTKRGVRDVPDAVQRTKSVVCLDPFPCLSFCVGRGFPGRSQGYFLINYGRILAIENLLQKHLSIFVCDICRQQTDNDPSSSTRRFSQIWLEVKYIENKIWRFFFNFGRILAIENLLQKHLFILFVCYVM